MPGGSRRLLPAQLRQQDARGRHAQRRAQQLGGRYGGRPAFRRSAVQQVYVIGCRIQPQLAHVLDRDDAFAGRNLPLNAFINVVLPEPVWPATSMALPACTASRRKSSHAPRLHGSSKGSGRAWLAPGTPGRSSVSRNSSDSGQMRRAGLRMVSDSVPGSQAGGTTICTRSPPGRDAASKGRSGQMSRSQNRAVAVARACR